MSIEKRSTNKYLQSKPIQTTKNFSRSTSNPWWNCCASVQLNWSFLLSSVHQKYFPRSYLAVSHKFLQHSSRSSTKACSWSNRWEIKICLKNLRHC